MKITKFHVAIAGYFFAVAVFTVSTTYANALFLSTYPGSYLPYLFAIKAVLDAGFATILAIFLKTKTHSRSIKLHLLFAVLILGCIFLLQINWFFTPFIIATFCFNLSVLIILLAWANIRAAFDVIEFKRISTAILTASTLSFIVFGALVFFLLQKFSSSILLYLLIFLMLANTLCIQQLKPLPTIPKALTKGVSPLSYELYQKFFMGIFFLNICFTLAEYCLKFKLGELYNAEKIGSYMAIFIGICNIIALFITALTTKPLLNRYGIKSILILLPIYWIVSAVAVFFHPTLLTVSFMAAGEMILANSTLNLGRELIFNIMPNQLQIAGQFLIRATAIPVAQGFAALFLFLFASYIGISGIALLLLLLCIVFIVLCWNIGSSYVQTLKQEILLKRFNIGSTYEETDRVIINNVIINALNSTKPSLIAWGYSLLSKFTLPALPTSVINHLHSKNKTIRIATLEAIKKYQVISYIPQLLQRLEQETDPEVISWILKTIASIDVEKGLLLARVYISSPVSELRTAAISVLLNVGNSQDVLLAMENFISLLQSTDVTMRRGAAMLIKDIHNGNLTEEINSLIRDKDILVSGYAIEAAAKSMPLEYAKIIIPRLTQGHIIFSHQQPLIKLGTQLLPLIKTEISKSQNKYTVNYSPLIKLLLAIDGSEIEKYIIDIATSQNILLKLALAKEMAYHARTTSYNTNVLQAIRKILLTESQTIYLLDALKKQSLESYIIAEFSNRKLLTITRMLYWLAAYSNPTIILNLIPVILSRNQIERGKALELVINTVKDTQLSNLLVQVFAAGNSVEWKEDKNIIIIDDWLNKVQEYLKNKGVTMDTMQRVFTLRQVELFKNLPGEILFEIAEETLTVDMQTGQIIFNQGDPPSGLYVVASGEVEIIKNQHVITTLKENDFFGELALLDNSPRSATVRAKCDGLLLYLKKDTFDRITDDIPEVLRTVVQTIMNYLRQYIDEKVQ